MRPVAAVASASLLGIGLAYCACMLLVPAWGFENSFRDVLCSSDSSASSPQRARIDAAVELEAASNGSETTRALSPPR